MTRAEGRRRSRVRARGVSHVSTVLEASAVMGWFVVLILGERAVSNAAAARRAAEQASQTSAATASASYCAAPGGEASPETAVRVTLAPGGKLDIAGGLGALSGLGLGAQRTFAYYERPLANVQTSASSIAGDRTFTAERALGCLERPLDAPRGSLALYRAPIWTTNLMGY